MNCEQYQEKLNAFFDGERNDPSAGETFAHLFGCPACQTFWREIVDFRNMAANDSIPYPSAIDRSVYGLQRRKRNASSFEFHLRMPRFAFATAAALLLIIAFAAGYLISDRRTQEVMPVQMSEYALPARVVYVYAIPGATVYANDEIHKSPRDLKPEIQHNAIY